MIEGRCNLQPTWKEWAEILLDLDAPLDNQTGHFTSIRHPSNRELISFEFHPWDCSREDWQERAGPGTMPSFHYEWAREAGRKMRKQWDDAFWKEFMRPASTNS